MLQQLEADQVRGRVSLAGQSHGMQEICHFYDEAKLETELSWAAMISSPHDGRIMGGTTAGEACPQ
jgi:hypothetical protein